MAIEISFPRGGRKPQAGAKPQDIEHDQLFGRRKKKQVYKHAAKSNVIHEQDTQESVTLHVKQLSASTIQDGMILIGCIKEIKRVALEISLPGRLWGKVFVNSISKPYTKLLQTVIDDNEAEGYKELNELFTLGQCVAVKVLNLNDEKYGITLSMMPQQINANISHTSIKTGMTLWGAISEVEDHGYVVDLGVNNCRAFLKTEECNTDINYVVGQLLWFSVIKANISSTATTVMLTAKKEKVDKIKINDSISLDHLLPGMQLDFTISEVLSNGLEGKFFNDYTGYIDVGQLKKSLHDKDTYEVENVLQARILYVMPVTKIAYFTLKNLAPHKKGKIEDGAMLNCKIQGVTPFGIYIKFGASRGFVPLHRARNSIPPNVDISDYAYLKQYYRKQSQHQCRVLNYDYFEQIYICTIESNLIDSDVIFTLDNVEAGQIVSAIIKEIQPNGLLVTVQHVNGFIKNEHICDTLLKNYNSVKSRLKVGQKIQARVWVANKTKNVFYLTMRPSLVNTESVLNNYENVKENQQFLGVIRQITPKGLLVQFFGDVHGWVPQKKMMFEGVENPNLLFKPGQLVQCRVVNCKKQKLTLSLQSSTEITKDVKPELKLGEHVDGIVSHVTSEGVHVTVKNYDIAAFVPTLYLSKFPKLAPVVAKMYHPGDEISDLVCVNKNDVLPTLSLRDSDLNEDNIQQIKTLKLGTTLSCSVLTKDSFGINVEAPIQYFKKTVVVPKENISDERDIPASNIKLHQQIYAKVFNVNKTFDAITASTRLSDVWDYDIQSSVQYFSEYINELLRVREHFKSFKNPLACLNLGEMVSGVVKSVNEDNSCIVQLENGARAVVQSEHSKENISVNDEVEGVVLCWNFEDDVAEIAICSKLIPKINQIQSGSIKIPAGVTNKSNAHAEVLLVKDDFVLGVLRGAAGKRQLIFFPSKLHPNDLKPDLSAYVIGDYINVQVNKIENGIIIGLLKQLVKDMNYKWKNKLKYKRQSDNNSDEQPAVKRVKLETSNGEKKNNKKKEKKSKQPETDEVSEDEIETNFKVKEQKKSKRKNNVEDNSINVSILSEEENVEPTAGKNKKKKQKKRKLDENISDEVSEDEIETNIKVREEKKSKRKMNEEILEETSVEVKKTKKEKANKISNGHIVDEPKKSKKERKKNNSISISSEEENVEPATQENKKEKQKKRKLDKEKVNSEIQTTKKLKQDRIIDDIPVILPGADNFWNFSEEPVHVSEDSSDDDDIDQKELEKKQKKKKLTPAERAEISRLEEERIRKIELELADAETAPKTPDQFDRLVLANPNNSMLWINYMAFQLEATEIEKARAIARKALNTIEFREEQEKLNVWIAFLNLENRYGTKESFGSVLEEAVKMNDSLTVYLQALQILSESKKITEFLELVRTVSRKFKQEFKMWTGTAEECYKNDLKEEARDLMQRSLKSLDEKQHINILVQFAFMEARHNEPERAEALLEKVLASYPRRVDVWTSYVDMLIKGNRIHIARNVLERAVGQKLPARKMKTIFTKFIQFETKYGDEESVKKVRKLATEYIKTALQ